MPGASAGAAEHSRSGRVVMISSVSGLNDLLPSSIESYPDVRRGRNDAPSHRWPGLCRLLMQSIKCGLRGTVEVNIVRAELDFEQLLGFARFPRGVTNTHSRFHRSICASFGGPGSSLD